MKKKYSYYVFIFFLAAIFGWFGEVIFNLIVHNKLVNPGTLSLCWCPIYGIAAVIISLIANNNDKVWINAIKIGAVSVVDEYIAAVISEEIFHNQLWDYSTHFMNFQGRISLSMTILFIIVGILSVYFILPKVDKIYNKNYKIINKLNYLLIVVFILNIIFDSIV